MADKEKVVEMLSDPEFIQTHWAEKPKVFSAHGLFEDSVSALPMNRWLEMYAEINPDAVEQVFAGEHKPVNLGPHWDPNNILESIKKTAEERTLILYFFHVMNKFYREITEVLSEKFGLHSTAGMFLALNQTSGLSKHRDRQETFVFQHSGICHWTIWQGYDRRRLALKHELKPGEILYIPSGFPHLVKRLSKSSAHVTTAYHYSKIEMEDFYLMLTQNPLLSLAYRKHEDWWDRIVMIAEKRKLEISQSRTTSTDPRV